jgi:hypothetical protein
MRSSGLTPPPCSPIIRYQYSGGIYCQHWQDRLLLSGAPLSSTYLKIWKTTIKFMFSLLTVRSSWLLARVRQYRPIRDRDKTLACLTRTLLSTESTGTMEISDMNGYAYCSLLPLHSQSRVRANAY